MTISSVNGFQPPKDTVAVQPRVFATDVQKKPDKTSGAVTQDPEQQNAQEIQGAVDALNKAMASSSQNLQFSMDQDLGKVVVKVIDTETKEVLRQIPNSEVLAISKSISRLQGLMIHDKA
jgi:flagellar protein FlaG